MISVLVTIRLVFINLVTYAKQNTLGVKKCKANQKQHCKQVVQPKTLISAEAKKLLYQIFLTP